MKDEDIEALKKRITDLEAEVARLKAQPPQIFHYYYSAPLYAPQPYYPQPMWPGPLQPYIGNGLGGQA